MRIAVLHPYFGRFPEYWPLTLASMGRNSLIDWHLFTDQQVEDAPDNVVVHPMTFGEFRSRLSEKLGEEIVLPYPYKICDFRPAFGVIFENELAGYDYWGYGDLDVVLGDIAGQLSAALDAGMERVLVHGHLSLLANTERVNHAFQLEVPGIRTAREAFSEPRALSFDEFGGWHALAEAAGLSTFGERAYFDIYVDAYRLQANRSRRQRNDTVFAWSDGRCLELDRRTADVVSEAAYIHLQKRPMRAEGIAEHVRHSRVFAFGPVDVVPAASLEEAVAKSVSLDSDWSSRVRWTRHYARFRASRAWRRLRRELHLGDASRPSFARSLKESRAA